MNLLYRTLRVDILGQPIYKARLLFAWYCKTKAFIKRLIRWKVRYSKDRGIHFCNRNGIPLSKRRNND